MATRTETIALIRNIIKDDNATSSLNLLDATEVGECIDRAVDEYSKDKPLINQNSKIGNSEHELALPSDWINKFSSINNIEYPAGDQVPTYIDENNYLTIEEDTTSRTIDTASTAATSITLSTASEATYFADQEIIEIGDDDASETNWASADGNTTTGVLAVKNAIANTYDSNPYVKKIDNLLLKADEPLSSEYMVLQYTLPHTHSDASDTIYTNDYRAVAYLSAAYACFSIAAIFAKKQDSTHEADSMDFGAKAAEWQARGEKFEAIYNDHIGKGEEEKKAASSAVDIDARFQWGRSLLFHGQKTR